MNRKKDKVFFAGIVLGACLLCAAVSSFLTARFHRQEEFRLLGDVCGELNAADPEAARSFLAAFKAYLYHPQRENPTNLLAEYGYRPSDLPGMFSQNELVLGIGIILLGSGLVLGIFAYEEGKSNKRIQALIQYLEQVNTGSSGVLFPVEETDCSRLQDEIYKTVTFACQTRDAALKARENFADNLSNIAHQLKTPITSISLSVQMLNEEYSPGYLDQISRQLSRLAHLEEALLLLSRVDAGALSLKRKKMDVFSLLSLAADNLEEVCAREGVCIEIPEAGEISVEGDLEWTMEAVMNLMKNCVEHSPKGGTVHSSYERNPLYTEIRIWDEGEGISRKDLPHLFERFYRGENAGHEGIGLGLSLARELVEMQNGTLRAYNLPGSGGCFEIRFYCH